MRDHELRRLLETVDHPVDPEPVFSEALFERLASDAAGRRAPGSSLLLLLAATLLLAAAIGLGAAVAGGLVHLPWVAVLPAPTSAASPLTVSPSPTPSAVRSASPSSPGGVQLVQAPAGVLPYRSTVSIIGSSVEIHAEPDSASAVVATVGSGSRLVVGLPLVVGGVLWYDVSAPDLASQHGFAALDPTNGTVTVESVACPQDLVKVGGGIALRDLSALAGGWEGLACLGNTELSIHGVEITSGLGGVAPGTWSPPWLAYPIGGLVLAPEGDPAATVAIRLPPSVTLPTNPSPTPGVARVFSVTGHFEDATSASCSITDQPLGDSFAGGPTAPVDPAHAVVYCQEAFVATSVTVTGTTRDPLMP